MNRWRISPSVIAFGAHTASLEYIQGIIAMGKRNFFEKFGSEDKFNISRSTNWMDLPLPHGITNIRLTSKSKLRIFQYSFNQ